MVIFLEFRMNPRNSSSCIGESTLFFRLIMNPRDNRSCMTVDRCLLASSFDLAIISMSSRYRIRRIPSFRSVDTTGFMNFVKTYGALLSPNGRD